MADYSSAGSTLAIGDGASPEVFTTIAGITNVGDIGVIREALARTAINDTVRKTRPGLIDGGVLDFEGVYDPLESSVDTLWTRATTTNPDEANYKITLATSPAESLTFTAHVLSFMYLGVAEGNLHKFRCQLDIQTVLTVA